MTLIAEPSLSCTRCGYDLSGVPIADALVTCPECGLAIATNRLQTNLPHKRWHWSDFVLVTSPAWIGGLGVLLARGSSDGIATALWTFIAMSASTVAGPMLYLVFGAMRAASRPESPRRTMYVAATWFLVGIVSFSLIALEGWLSS